jgi:hypothetical protein
VAGIDLWWDDLTRDRAAAILELVLDAISDDYENLEIILRTINRCYRSESDLKGWKALEAVPVSHLEVINALRELTQEGFAQACVFDADAKQFQAVSFRPELVTVLWFYVTDKGMNAAHRLHKRGAETA